MSAHLSGRWSAIRGAAILGLTVVACTDASTSSGIGARQMALRASEVATDGEPNSAAGDTKAFIGAWLDGEAVQLRYTRSYFCEEPPSSVAPSGCEIGALPEDFPRGGRIPVIYAIAPIGFTPANPATLHCPGEPLCPNHPPMIDVSRLNIPGVTTVARAPHSHIISSRQAGWHRTVNIRVLNSSVWNQIVASPSLETVRTLQATLPGQISGDNPTNIFFFFHPAGETPAP
jgi:hypothetical protein